MGVVPIGPNGTATAERAVDGTSRADREALQTAHERGVSVCLDDEVKMIDLHAEMEETKSRVGSPTKRAADFSKHVVLAQRADVRLGTNRHMDGALRRVRRPALMRDSAATRRGLSTRTSTPPAPRSEGKVELS
jgi:hypothetical protein